MRTSLRLLADAPDSLYARGSATADDSLPIWLWVLAALAAFIFIGGVVLLILGSRKGALPHEESPDDGAGPAPLDDTDTRLD